VIKSRKIIWAVHVTCIGKRRRAYIVLVGKSEGQSQIGKT
jgi:hypothetical protein